MEKESYEKDELTTGGKGEEPSFATTTQIWLGKEVFATVLGKHEKQNGKEHT